MSPTNPDQSADTEASDGVVMSERSVAPGAEFRLRVATEKALDRATDKNIRLRNVIQACRQHLRDGEGHLALQLLDQAWEESEGA